MSLASTEAFAAGERIAKFSVITLVSIGLIEIAVGFWTESLGLTADGVDALSDSFISLIVWIGLRYSRRGPDDRFHFGYHKVESLSVLVISMGMVATAGYILYQAYFAFLNPREIRYAPLALATLVGAGLASLYRAFQMRTIANRYGLISLRTDANNSIKDASASFIVFANVLGASLGVRQLDAVGGMIISFFIFGVAYVAIKQSSLILLDAFENPELTSALGSALRTVDGVHDMGRIRLRLSGPYVTGIIWVFVDENTTVARTE